MNRRRFLGTLLGTGASTLVPPSMVWPFRKIFLPTIPRTQFRIVTLEEITILARNIIERDSAAIIERAILARHLYLGDTLFVLKHREFRIPMQIPDTRIAMVCTDVDFEKKEITFAPLRQEEPRVCTIL